jgi:tetratricopeptide (TPR) repeat protein
MILGIMNKLRGRYVKALHFLQISERNNPDGFWTRYYLAETYYKLGREDEALRDSKSLTSDFPENPNAYVPLTAALQIIGQNEEALEVVNMMLEVSKPDSKIFKKAVQGKLEILVLLGRLDDAKRLAEDHKIKWFDEKDLSRLSVKSKLYESARLYHDGNQEEAKLVLAQVIKADPSNPDALSSLASILMDLGHYDEANELLLRAHGLQPSNFVVMSLLAKTYYELGDYRLAEKYAKKAVSHHPDIGVPYSVLADVYEKSKRPGIKMNVAQLRREAAMRGGPK